MVTKMSALTEHAQGVETRSICFGANTEFKLYCQRHNLSKRRKPLCHCKPGTCKFDEIHARLRELKKGLTFH